MRYSRAVPVYRVLIALFLALLLTPLSGEAAVSPWEQTSAVTLRCHFNHKNGAVHYMTGDVYGLYLIAEAVTDLSGESPVVTYKTLDKFMAYDADWAGLDAAGLHRAALRLEAAVRGVKADYSAAIDSAGEGRLENLPNGYYLVARETIPPANAAYKMSPFLFGSVVVDEGILHYELIITPKYLWPGQNPPDPTAPTNPTSDPPNRPYRPYRPGDNGGGGRVIYRDNYVGDGGDPGTPTVTVPGANTPLMQVPDGTTPLLQKPLPQTGQLKWPVPALIVAGVLLFLTGFELRYGERRQDEEK